MMQPALLCNLKICFQILPPLTLSQDFLHLFFCDWLIITQFSQGVCIKIFLLKIVTHDTVKSLSEALIFASTNPQYDNRLSIELQVQYMNIPSSNLGRTCCVQNCFWHSEQFLYTTCSPVFFKKNRFWQRFTCKRFIIH